MTTTTSTTALAFARAHADTLGMGSERVAWIVLASLIVSAIGGR